MSSLLPVAEGERGADASVRAETMLAVTMVGVIAVMMIPLPTLVLDLLLALSISLALVVFLFSLHIDKPLRFSAFPSLLLLMTLFRLALNVASTRAILLRGHQGASAAGKVLQAFGEFVVGGNLVVGIIVFLILVVINFVVITKGAGRIAEVAARFALDGMPGKQMAIDADLAAGAITEIEAKNRRKLVEHEADFFGSMDGASKFVRGDAIAGLIITAVNIVGGLIVGIAQHQLPAGTALSSFTQLTIGDGLVSQVPALLTSIAAGLVTTRAAAGGELGKAVGDQLFGTKRPLQVAAGVLAGLAVIPGMPFGVFLSVGGLLLFLSNQVSQTVKQETDPLPEKQSELEATKEKIEASLPVHLLEIEVGYELVPLVDSARDGSLVQRISGIRRQIAQELGVMVPPVHMRDNLRLHSGEYRLLLSGQVVAKGELRVGQFMAMSHGDQPEDLPGIPTVEPAYGLPAIWINGGDRDRAEMSGMTVVDASTVAATHLGEVLAQHAHELLGRRELQELLDLHGDENSKVIEELIPTQLSLGALSKVLRNLLRERVSIRDFRTILETVADYATEQKDPDALSELVRQRLARQICAQHADEQQVLHAMVPTPQVEAQFRKMLGMSAGTLSAEEAQGLLKHFDVATQELGQYAEVPVLLVASDLRREVSRFVARQLKGISVLSFKELSESFRVERIGSVGELGS